MCPAQHCYTCVCASQISQTLRDALWDDRDLDEEVPEEDVEEYTKKCRAFLREQSEGKESHTRPKRRLQSLQHVAALDSMLRGSAKKGIKQFMPNKEDLVNVNSTVVACMPRILGDCSSCRLCRGQCSEICMLVKVWSHPFSLNPHTPIKTTQIRTATTCITKCSANHERYIKELGVIDAIASLVLSTLDSLYLDMEDCSFVTRTKFSISHVNST